MVNNAQLKLLPRNGALIAGWIAAALIAASEPPHSRVGIVRRS